MNSLTRTVTVDDVKVATKWHDVTQTKSGILITFGLLESRYIVGLDTADGSYRLNFPDFDHTPIGFMVYPSGRDQSIYAIQYWTLGGRLHRSNGPAKIITRHQQYERYWFYGGVLHNPHWGPTIERCNNFRVENGVEKGTFEFEYKNEGIPGPIHSPSKVTYSDAERTTGDISTIKARKASFIWNPEAKGIEKIEFGRLDEQYQNRILRVREYESIIVEVKAASDTDDDSIDRARDVVFDKIAPKSNLFYSELYQSNQQEYGVLALL